MRIRCRVMASFFQKASGLMFSRKVAMPLLFVFDRPARHAIHSLFCPPFDAVFLGGDGRVVDKFRVHGPRLWMRPKKDAKYLIEAKPGFSERLKEGQAVSVNADDAWLEIG